MTSSPFRRLMVVNSSPEPDLDLIRFAGLLGSSQQRSELMIATPAGEMAMRYLAPWSRCALAGQPNAALSFRVMLEPHLGLLFDMAKESGCDLIVTRHPRTFEHSKALLSQLLFDSPCAVCLVPGRQRPTLKRPMVRIELTPKGRELLSQAALFAKAMGSEKLFAAHTYFSQGSGGADTRELDLYRFIARTDLAGVNCTPLLEDSPKPSATLLRLVAHRNSDLLIIDPDLDQAPSWQWNRREAVALAGSIEIPILATRVAPQLGILDILRSQVFCAMEPSFN